MSTDNNPVFAELGPLQKRIGEDETRSIEARWEFGRVLLRQRLGGQLPRGMRKQITEYFSLEASEITRRMQLAERFSTREEVVDACTRCGSWRRIIREELTKRPQQRREMAWAERARRKLDRLMAEAGESDDQHDALMALLRAALQALGADVAEVQS